jgi:hypothetical protein
MSASARVREALPDRLERFVCGPRRGDSFWWRWYLVCEETDAGPLRATLEVAVMTARARNHAAAEGFSDPFPQGREDR